MTTTPLHDQETTLATLKQAVSRFIAARCWEPFHTPKNISMSIAIEAAEIMEHFQWLTPEEAALKVDDPQSYAEIADELADVLIYCLSFANVTGIDISASVQAKLERNESRFPPKSR